MDIHYEKKYKEALGIAKSWYHTVPKECKNIFERMFSELRESKGERIRKVIYGWIYTQPSQFFDGGFSKEEMLAWLEKQGEVFDKIVERARTEKQRVLVTESDGVANIDWDTRSLQNAKLLMEYGLNYIKKKLSKQDKNKLLPKFSVGQRIRNRRGEMPAFVIDRIENDSYKGENGESVSVVFQDDWELVEQKPKFRVGDTIRCKCDDRQFTIKSVDLDKGTYTYTQEGCGNDIDYADEEFELVEQRPVEKVVPKFKVGDTIADNDIDEYGYGTIKEIKGGQYVFTDGSGINIDEQNEWHLVEQKPVKVK